MFRNTKLPVNARCSASVFDRINLPHPYSLAWLSCNASQLVSILSHSPRQPPPRSLAGIPCVAAVPPVFAARHCCLHWDLQAKTAKKTSEFVNYFLILQFFSFKKEKTKTQRTSPKRLESCSLLPVLDRNRFPSSSFSSVTFSSWSGRPSTRTWSIVARKMESKEQKRDFFQVNKQSRTRASIQRKKKSLDFAPCLPCTSNKHGCKKRGCNGIHVQISSKCARTDWTQWTTLDVQMAPLGALQTVISVRFRRF